MNSVGEGRRGGRWLLAILVGGAAMVAAACGADEPPSASRTSVEAELPVAPTQRTDPDADPDADPDPEADPTDAVALSTDATEASAPLEADGADSSGDAADSGTAADLDAEPLPSDPTGDVPARPPADGGQAVPGGDGRAPPDSPGPAIDTDISPDNGEVRNGVSGSSEVRQTLQYPAAPVLTLGRGATTDLATELAGSDQPTLLWFWTPDCPTCVPESDAVARFADTYRGSIRVLAVGAGGSRADADSFAAAAGIDDSLLVWAQGTDTHDHYNVTATPFSIMVAPNGVVMAQWRGMVPELFAFADRL